MAMEDIQLWKRRLDRERTARKQAEEILEHKALELFNTNRALLKLNEDLEEQVADRTEHLIQSQQRLETMVASLDGGILLVDEHDQILLVNQRFCDILTDGVSPNELKGKPLGQKIKHSKSVFGDAAAFEERIALLSQKRTLALGEVIKTVNEEIFERDFIPIYRENRYLGHLWYYRDVTVQYKSSEKIRKSEEKYRGIIENMRLGILEVDKAGVVIKASDLFCEMVGYSNAELEGVNPEKLLLPTKYQGVMQDRTQSRLLGVSDVYEIQVRRKDGELIWLLVSGAPYYGIDGKIKGSIGLHHDITNEKRMNEDLMMAKIKAEEAQKAEKEFLAHMSHEIRTPLNAIIGMSHLLYDTNPSPQQKVYLDTLRNAGTILHRLINDILDFSKIEAGAIEVNKEPFDLKSMVMAMKQTFEVKLENTDVAFLCHFDSQIVHQVIGDELLLQRILLNLLGNAAKFTATGSITLDVTLEEQFQKDLLISFKVSDTGIGIPEDKLDYIFQDFKQASSSTSIKYGGTGLGLAITKQLVDLMEGLIFVESEVGLGTRFTVELPYKDSGISILPPKEQANGYDHKLKSSAKLLIVEDNEMNRAYIGGLLKKWGIYYEVAKDGIEALEMTKDHLYDLIIMDIRMPRMNGYEATINIRNQGANVNQKTPIVALTASAMESEKSKALNLGMNDFLTKPFAPDTLKKLLKDYLSIQRFEKETPTVQQHYIADLDVPYLESFYEDDYESALEMFEMFLDQIVPEIKELEALTAAQSWAQLRALIHKVKPTFSMVGLTFLTDKAAMIEKDLDDGLHHNAAYETNQLLLAYEASLPLVIAQVNKLKSAVHSNVA